MKTILQVEDKKEFLFNVVLFGMIVGSWLVPGLFGVILAVAAFGLALFSVIRTVRR